MIKKERTQPLKLKKIEALQRRLPAHHAARDLIDQEWAKLNAGFNGERSFDYQLALLPEKECLILHDIRLPDPRASSQDHFFQLDTVILMPGFILIVEIKNIAGTLRFDESFHQMIRTVNGQEEGFPDPLLQTTRQQLQLRSWLERQKIPPVPVESIIVISHPSTIIEASPSLTNQIIHSEYFSFQMKKMLEQHRSECLSKKNLRKLSTRLLKQHVPPNPDVLQLFKLRRQEVIHGVHCPQCLAIPMIRKHGVWLCRTCAFSSRDAHVAALQDYAMLFGPLISNRQLCSFLQLSSRHVAKSIVKGMQLNVYGRTKAIMYELPSVE